MSDHDDGETMSVDESAAFALLNLANDNITDAIGFIMHDGDVRPDSVMIALKLAQILMLHDADVTDDDAATITEVTDRLIRFIEHWETT